MTDKFLLVYEEEEVVFSFELDFILKDQDRSNPVIFLDEDEYLYVGTNKLNVIDLYEEDDIRIYETSAGFNSILEDTLII